MGITINARQRISLISVVGISTSMVLFAAPLGTNGGAAQAAESTSASMLAPYYTELDLDGDEQVTTTDLAVVAKWKGTTAEDSSWAEASIADVNDDGKIDVQDLAIVSERIIYDDGPFELIEADVVSMQAAMNAGVTTSVDITQEYLDRIAAYDETSVDPNYPDRQLNSIITTNTTALEAAAEADSIRAENGMTSMLLGVPVAVKDNYNTADMPTTAGCGCWDANQTANDSALVAGMRSDGAVLIAKASMDEFAYGYVSEFSAYQEPGQSTLVASPYFLGQSAGGSSGGSAAAVSSNLVGIALGTDTGGSIRVPASYNQLVGIRPTVGLASRDGIVPLALSQDTGGPIARSVLDAAVTLDSLAGVDSEDPITSQQEGQVPDSYTEYLDGKSLAGAVIGYVPSMIGTEAANVRLWEEAKQRMIDAGAEVVAVEVPTTGSEVLPGGFQSILDEGSGSNNEFKHDLNEYIAKFLNPSVEANSLQGILDSGNYVPSRQSTYAGRNNVTEETYQNWAGEEGTHTQVLAAGKVLMTEIMDANGLDALVYPSGSTYGTVGKNMRLSPNTGMPSVTVPMGQSIEADGDELVGANINLEFLGRDYEEGPILGLAYAFESITGARTTPTSFPALD